MTWAALIVAHLQRSKQAGLDFDTAWRQAIAAHPPRPRDYGEPPASLFDPPTEGLVEFTRRMTADAWAGRNPRLRYFGADVVVELRDRDASRAPLPA